MNLIDALINLIEEPVLNLRNEYVSFRNRANSMGGALEEYVKDLFSDSVDVVDEADRSRRQSNTFSYLGNQNNPPDMILKLGDGIEVKKLGSENSGLSLNSSYPKAKLLSSSRMITAHCRGCERDYVTEDSPTHRNGVWIEKDIIYCVGVVTSRRLRSLAFVYGVDYAADNEVYERINATIQEGVHNIPNVEFGATKELGRVNRVDPLGITHLRVRGMWGIQNPFKVFNYVYQRDLNKVFNCMAIINKKKWDSFENREMLISTIEKNNHLATIRNIEIKDPNNPARLKDAILISIGI